MNTGNDVRKIIISRIKSKDDNDSDLSRLKISAQKELIELDGRKRFFNLRDKWSNCIIVWITSFILFHIGITIGVGTGKLDFHGNDLLLPSIIIENFLQIVGMGYVVIKFLYPPSNNSGK